MLYQYKLQYKGYYFARTILYDRIYILCIMYVLHTCQLRLMYLIFSNEQTFFEIELVLISGLLKTKNEWDL